MKCFVTNYLYESKVRSLFDKRFKLLGLCREVAFVLVENSEFCLVANSQDTCRELTHSRVVK